MKNFIKEFKEFISRGNILDMALGIIIGGTFTAIVNSLVEDIISPFLGLLGGMNFDQLSVNLLGEVTLYYGKFLTNVVNFLIMALVIFSLVKIMSTATTKLPFNKEEEAPTTKTCPFCKSEIPIDATRCRYCTSEITQEHKDGDLTVSVSSEAN